jgi:hypothetical protein
MHNFLEALYAIFTDLLQTSSAVDVVLCAETVRRGRVRPSITAVTVVTIVNIALFFCDLNNSGPCIIISLILISAIADDCRPSHPKNHQFSREAKSRYEFDRICGEALWLESGQSPPRLCVSISPRGRRLCRRTDTQDEIWTRRSGKVQENQAQNM